METRGLFLILCMMIADHAVRGSVITFTSTPASVHPSLTPSLILRCSITGSNPTPSSGLVGRSLSRRGGEIQHVTSVIIMKDGVDVAMATPYVDAHSLLTKSNLSVKGGVAETNGERGYLEIELSYPSDNDTGEYECEIGGVSSTGHNIALSKTLVVTSAVTTVLDLVSEIHALKQIAKSQQSLIDAHHVEMTHLRTTVNNTIQNLTTELQQSRQRDSGTIWCGWSTSWGADAKYGSWISKSVHQSFNASFAKPPLVHLSMSKYFNNVNSITSFLTEVVQVNQDSFDMKCMTVQNVVSDMWVSWVAIAT